MSSVRGRIVALAIALAFVVGCGDDDDSTAPEIDNYRPQSSVENVLYNLEQAYERRDLVAYEKLFARDFVFISDPPDGGDGPDIPIHWGLEGELTTARRMFTDSLVTRVTVDFLVGGSAPPLGGELPGRTFPNGTMKVVLTEIDLRVEAQDPHGGEITYKVDDDEASFFIYPHATESVEELPVWYVFEWRDHGTVLAAPDPGEASTAAGQTIETTWGGIKSLYY